MHALGTDQARGALRSFETLHALWPKSTLSALSARCALETGGTGYPLQSLRADDALIPFRTQRALHTCCAGNPLQASRAHESLDALRTCQAIETLWPSGSLKSARTGCALCALGPGIPLGPCRTDKALGALRARKSL